MISMMKRKTTENKSEENACSMRTTEKKTKYRTITSSLMLKNAWEDCVNGSIWIRPSDS